MRSICSVTVLAVLVGIGTTDTAVAGGDFPSFVDAGETRGMVGAHQPSFQYLISNIPIAPMTSGGAAADFDRDGDTDVYMAGGGDQPDRLFINDGTGHFTDMAAEWGMYIHQMSNGAAAGDFNNDGWVDLYVLNVGIDGDAPEPGMHRLYRNNGDNTFTDIAEDAGVNYSSPVILDGMGACFGDYDLDGDLDLFVTGWVLVSGNRLFRNNGDETFTDVTNKAGVLDTSLRGFTPRFVDMNGDRYPELLIAADFETSRYFINNTDGTFTDATVQANTGLDDNGMGQTVGDFNHDGLFDWYVSSIHSVEPIPPNVPGSGNMLYLNQGDDYYCEVSGSPYIPPAECPAGIDWGCNDGGWGWGTTAVDINLDSFEDIVETNGWFQHDQYIGEPCHIYLHDGDDKFTDIAGACGFDHDLMGRGLINLDIDNDGDQDFVVFSYFDEVQLYENTTPTDNHWFRAFLDTAANPRLAPDGFGTVVRATFTDPNLGTIQRHRVLSGGSNYLSTSELSVHFGLAGAAKIDTLRFEWTDGTVTVLDDVDADQTLTIASGYRADLTGDGKVDARDLARVLAAFNTANTLADLDASGVVDDTDVNLILENWNP